MTTQEFNSEYRSTGWKDEPIGVGSYGRVFKFYRIRDSLAVAVKIVDIKKEKLSGFNNERDILALVSRGGEEETKHICKVLGIYTDSRGQFEAKIVMPLMQGGSLRGFYNYHRERGNLSFAEYEVHNFFNQIVSGMKYLHRLNICHRDLKPENILIEKSLAESFKSGFVLKIADFGVADYFVKNEKNFSKSAGTLGYAAPEILAKKNYDEKCDIWSLGIMMMEAIGFYNVGILENLPKSNTLVIHQELELKFPPHTTQRFMNLMHKALKRNPDDRISVDDFLNDEYFIWPCGAGDKARAPVPPLAHALQGLQIRPPQVPAESSVREISPSHLGSFHAGRDEYHQDRKHKKENPPHK